MSEDFKTYPRKKGGRLDIDLSTYLLVGTARFLSYDSLSILQMGKLVFPILRVPHLGEPGLTTMT